MTNAGFKYVFIFYFIIQAVTLARIESKGEGEKLRFLQRRDKCQQKMSAKDRDKIHEDFKKEKQREREDYVIIKNLNNMLVINSRVQ